MALLDREVFIKIMTIKQMKTKIFFLLVFFKVAFYGYCSAQSLSKDTLYVESVNFGILTFSSVSCGVFATAFKDRIKFRVISNADTIAILNSYLKKTKYARKSSDIDVRAKFIYERGNDVKITVCTNGYEASIDGRLIRHNNKFVDFLRSLTMQL
jgi:hypothetical protein